MRKRLRKKLHRGEYQEFGFRIEWRFHAPLSGPTFDTFMDALIEFIEDRGLTFGGGTDTVSGSGFVCRAKNGATLEADRVQLQEWFHSHPEVVSVHADQLEDAWNPETG